MDAKARDLNISLYCITFDRTLHSLAGLPGQYLFVFLRKSATLIGVCVMALLDNAISTLHLYAIICYAFCAYRFPDTRQLSLFSGYHNEAWDYIILRTHDASKIQNFGDRQHLYEYFSRPS